ncbi:IS5 family transposase [Streptomyces meridianus]|uniref:IS5 family transposase n=1 Tax=Streptomyces meridianus TaxID=2938945 RepID=A0ABT0XAR1_9ACTN|nr:IS5 family transposase [Streptomyces meridianus]MCM2579610.1 IS5 family transposase [Streptomyces meridianus]
MSLLYVLTPVDFNSSDVSCDCLAHRFGNAADRPDRARAYDTDLTDAEWERIRPLLPVPAWMEGRGGRPEGYCHRVMLDAIFYVVDGGIKWRAMPVDFPPWHRVYAFFRRWRETGLVAELHDRLRGTVREAQGRDAEPTAAVIDSQSVKADAVVGSTSRGYDGGKKINGRRRHLICDTTGVLLMINVTAGSVTDRQAAADMLPVLRDRFPTIARLWADGGYTGTLITWALAALHLVVTVIKRSDDVAGFVVLPRRWVVERTFAWLMRSRRLARDYERRPDTSEVMILWSMTMLMTRRLAAPARA